VSTSYRTGGRLLVLVMAIVALGWGASHWLDRGLADEREEPAEHARAMSRAFRHAAEVAVPTVVTIRTTSTSEDGASGNSPLEQYRGLIPDELLEQFSGGLPQPQTGAGSGVIIDAAAGIVLTNNHVVADADEVLVRLSDGREFKGTDVKVDPRTDLAILRIEGAEDLPQAQMGDSDALEIGDWVIAVGSPFELESTVSAGIISNKGRDLGTGQRTSYLQTDAAINPGNSGGALVNLDGELVGINTAIATTNGVYQGVGFAIPINVAKRVTRQLIDRGSVERAYLGVAIDAVSQDMATQLGLKRGEGVLIGRVQRGSPADRAGIQEGDVVTRFGGKVIRGPRDLQENVEVCPIGSQQEVTLLRDGETVTLSVECAALPDDFGERSLLEESNPNPREGDGPGLSSDDLGLTVEELSDEEAEQRGVEEDSGVLVSDVEDGSVAAQLGVREGMVIQRVGKSPVSTVAEFEEALGEESLVRGVLFEVHFRGRTSVLRLRVQ
jgi:serine protease Do